MAGLTVAGLTGGAAGAASASSGPPGSQLTASLGGTRGLPPGYFGMNFDYGGAAVVSGDPDVAQQLAALNPGTLRWPGGTGADYFQWQKGYPVPESPPHQGTGKCESPKEGQTQGYQFSLADLAAAYQRTGAPPVFVLNVMTATLANQLQMLHTAQRQYGLPVRYVELGNEFYLCTADFVAAFPTAQDYGRVVATDTAALRRAFPGVRVAAVGTTSASGSRDQGWDQAVLSVATGAGRPDAFTLHDHPQFNQPLTMAGLPSLFQLPYTWDARLAGADLGGLRTWITEYGLSLHFSGGNPAQYTYANALFEAESAILLAQQVPSATLVNYWSAFGPGVNYAYTSQGLTPVGLVMEWLGQAVRGASAEAPVRFANVPVLGSSNDPAVVGEWFGRAEVLVNLGGNQVTIGVGRGIAPFERYQQVHANPVQKIGTAKALTYTGGVTSGSVTLAPYSITLIG